MTDRETYRRATDIFGAATGMPELEQEGFVVRACDGDGGLLELVRRMLESDRRSSCLDRPLAAMLDPEEEIDEAVALPASIGGFRLLARLGAGGMGVVYEAEQDQPRRRVALKLLRPQALSASMISRFRYEAELLGRLQHPYVAQVYAAGTEDLRGVPRPWIAMELVRGSPIDEYARRHDLSLENRLELLARVADAVQHAHQRGIIHRDLKSANVLVDEAGAPKVLDFGVARAEIADLRESMRTTPGLIVGTLPTMSPEQALATADLDARTDVYSLGVVAYEVLAGRLPLEVAELPLPLALRRVLEEDPPKLGALDRNLAGDVEVVVSKALEKDRERRYASAAAFGADLRRVRSGEPVEARPPSSIYLLRKLARRHRGLAVGSGLALLAVLAGLLAFALQSRATARAQFRAAEEARTVTAIDGYLLEDLLASPDPRESGREVRVLDVLERAAAGAEEAFPDSPELLARVRSTLGKSFFALDEFDLADQNLRASLDWQREHRGERDPNTLETEASLIELLVARQRFDEALPLARDSLARQREVLGIDHRTSLTTATNLATALMEDAPGEAEAMLRDVVARRERTLGADDTATLLARENLATLLSRQGRIEEALEMREACLALRRARYGDRDPGTLIARSFLASARLSISRLHDPVGTYQELVKEMEGVFGERHHRTTEAKLGLAVALERSGRPEEAIALYEAVIELRRTTLGEAHSETIEAEILTIEALQRLGLSDAAVTLAEETLRHRESGSGDAVSLGRTRLLAGETRLASGDRKLAARHARAALEALERAPERIAADMRRRARRVLQESEE